MSESNKTFVVNLSNPVNAGLTDGQGLASIRDNDLLPSLFINDFSVSEGNGGLTNAVFTVRLSAPSGRTITVNYATASGTALAGVDFLATNGFLSFAPGVTNQTLAVAVVGDTLSESNKTFVVNLTNAINAILADRQGLGTIGNDDVVPALTINDVTVVEGNSGTTNAVLTVSLSSASGRAITVGYATANGSAVAGRDFVSGHGTLRFAPGVTNQLINVAVLGDSIGETNKTFFVNLTNAVNATIADGRGACTILDNDNPPALVPASAGSSGHEIRITEARIVGTNVLVSFTTLPGQTCRVEFTDRVSGDAGVWLPVAGATNISGTGANVTVTDLGGAGHPIRIYRIRLAP